MADIRFDTGVQSFQINGGVSVEFNPTDSEFAKKLFSLFEELESRQHEYAKRAEKLQLSMVTTTSGRTF